MTRNDAFDSAIDHTLSWEGYYSNDADDPGGETKYGISKRSYPDLNIKNLTQYEAIEIYRRDYWDAVGLDQLINGQLAVKVFDLGVNLGPRRAVRFLQKASNKLGAGLDVDGILGPKTAGWINSYRHQGALMSAIRIIAGNYYMSLGKKKYIAGWLNRLEA